MSLSVQIEFEIYIWADYLQINLFTKSNVYLGPKVVIYGASTCMYTSTLYIFRFKPYSSAPLLQQWILFLVNFGKQFHPRSCSLCLVVPTISGIAYEKMGHCKFVCLCNWPSNWLLVTKFVGQVHIRVYSLMATPRTLGTTKLYRLPLAPHQESLSKIHFCACLGMLNVENEGDWYLCALVKY